MPDATPPGSPPSSPAAPAAPAQQPAQQSPVAQKAQDAAKKVQDAAKQFKDAEKGLQSKTGMKRIVVDGAKIVCDATIPPQTQNTLHVTGNRPTIEGKRQANVTDTKAGTNINPWPCQCRNQPMPGGGFKPCSYQPQGDWFPGVRTQPVDNKVPQVGNVPNMDKALDTAQRLQQQQGWGTAQASGMMGNAMVESGWMKNVAQQGGGNGRGLFQWSDSRGAHFNQWANQQGLNPSSEQANFGYLKREMSGAEGQIWKRGYDMDGFNRTQTPEQASDYFEKGFEMPGKPHSIWRRNTSRKIHDQLKNYAVCESDTLKCKFGGTISISHPNQSCKAGNPNSFAGASTLIGKK